MPMTTLLTLMLSPFVSAVAHAAEPSESASLIRPPLLKFFEPPADIPPGKEYRSPLVFADGTPVRTAADWQKRRAEILAAWHGRMGAWPPLLPRPAITVLETRNRDEIRQHHVRIEVAPERTSDDAYLLIPPGKGPFPAVIVVYYEAKTGIGESKSELRDYAIQLARRGFVTLSYGSPPESYYPSKENAQLQPLSYHAYVAANLHQLLANRPDVDAKRIGIVGHSYGGKWAMFASCLYDKFACAAWSDPGIVFDESRPNVNYWEPWYLGYEPGKQRKRGVITPENPRTGPYKQMIAEGWNLHELHALMAPRPFLVSGGSEDPPSRWSALQHTVAVNNLLGFKHRVGMTNRPGHTPTPESNEQIYQFFEQVLLPKPRQ
jgi:hypothetical protein